MCGLVIEHAIRIRCQRAGNRTDRSCRWKGPEGRLDRCTRTISAGHHDLIDLILRLTGSRRGTANVLATIMESNSAPFGNMSVSAHGSVWSSVKSVIS